LAYGLYKAVIGTGLRDVDLHGADMEETWVGSKLTSKNRNPSLIKFWIRQIMSSRQGKSHDSHLEQEIEF